jgi:hypothetical protein
VDRIRKVFQSLSKTEQRYLKSYLAAFHNKGKNKALEMIEVLEAQPDISQQEMAEQLYGNARSKAFIMLKGRLLEKMLETLSLSINFQNNPAFLEDSPSFEAIELQKNLMYATLLRRRGIEDLAREILLKCVKKAEDLNLPESKLQALVHLRNFSVSQEDVSSLYKQEINDALAQYETDILAVGIFDEYRVKTRHAFNTQEKIDFLKENIGELEAQLSACYSVRSHYYYLMLRVYLHELENDYAQGKESLEKLIQLVNTHDGLKSKNRLGSPYIQLSGVEMIGYNFIAAREAADRALAMFHPQKHNFLSAALYKLFASIYTGQLLDAETLLGQISWFREQERMKFAVGITEYLHSCMAYMHGEYRIAYQRLGEVSELFADKEGWNTGLRIYEIILLLDMDMPDLTSAKIETLRKHVSKYEVRKRTEIIFKFLYLLEKQSFDFQAISTEMEELLDQLTHVEPWLAVDPEVVRFDTWVRAHREGREFYPLFLEELKELHKTRSQVADRK